MTAVTASPNQWFVETDFGMLLGPMPADALVEMARTEALLPRDRVRVGTDGSWCSANDVSGLFDGVASPLGLPAARPGDPSPEAILDRPSAGANTSEVLRLRQANAVDESSSPRPKTAPRQAPLRSPRKPESPVDVAASSADPLKEVLESWPEERERQPAPSVARSSPKELQFELDTSLVESTAADNSSSSPGSLASTEREPPQTRDPAPPPAQVTAIEPMPPEPMWRSPLPAHLTERRFPTHLQPHVGKRRLLISTVSAAVLSVFVIAWWTWPRQRPDIYARYVAVYKEWQQRRENTSDQAGWNDFVAHARTEIEDVLPWLETRATPGARERSLLLYVGRDLHEMLSRPRESEYPHQARVDGFLNQLQAIYTPSKSNER